MKITEGGGNFSDLSKFASYLRKDVTSDLILPATGDLRTKNVSHLLGLETGSFMTKPNDSIPVSNKKAKREGSPSICPNGSKLFTSKLQKRRNRDRTECLEYENAIQSN